MCSALLGCQPDRQTFVIAADTDTHIFIAPSEPEYVRRAVDDLVEDITQITGQTLPTVNTLADCAGNCLVVGTVSDPGMRALVGDKRAATLDGAWETFAHFSTFEAGQNRLYIVGSNPRGTMFGIYHFLEEQLGVDPMKFWTGYEPEKQEEIVLEGIDYTADEPDFTFRGWFINDEDLLTEWKNGSGQRNIDYPYYGQVVKPEVMAAVVETAVRLRYNLIIPASFMDIRNSDEEALLKEAARRGLYLSMHHIEPVGVSAFGYQNYWEEQGEEPLFSFYSEREKIVQTWREYAERWARYPDVIWQVGLRGIGDRPMWLADPGMPQSDEDRGRLISDAIKLQKQIIQEATGNASPRMTTTLWAEGSYFFQKRFLEVPEDVIIVFSDNSAGWVWQQDFYETQRDPQRQYGVYYHHQLWGSGPHLAQAIPPSKTHEMFKKVVEHQSNDYLIMNVSNIREFVLGIEASTAMLWDFEAFTVDGFLQDWCARRFPEAPDEAREVYQQFFDAYQLSGEKQLPVFLDGLQRGKGMGILNQLDRTLKKTKQKEGEWAGIDRKGDPFHKSLSDMHPEAKGDLNSQLAQLQQQLDALEKVRTMAKDVEGKLTGQSQAFFTANLVAQANILYGIGNWLRACLQAQIALTEAQDMQQAHKHLQAALAALEPVETGKALAATGKWKDWYRGDKKMNLDEVRERTEEITSLVGARVDR